MAASTEVQAAVRVTWIDGSATGEIVGDHDGAAIVYWGTINGERCCTIEVLDDPRSRVRLV